MQQVLPHDRLLLISISRCDSANPGQCLGSGRLAIGVHVCTQSHSDEPVHCQLQLRRALSADPCLSQVWHGLYLHALGLKCKQ